MLLRDDVCAAPPERGDAGRECAIVAIIAAEFARVRPNDGEVRFIAYGKDIHRSSDI